jgi:phosphoenolpyruvate-protein phosphotransferase (PTS system enzyme I)
MRELRGIGVSNGVALGSVVFLKGPLILADGSFEGIDQELAKLQSALNSVKSETAQLVENLNRENRSSEAEIFEAHLMMLDDPEVFDTTSQLISTNQWPASRAYRSTIATFITTLESVADEYLRNRALDLKDISERVLAALTGADRDTAEWPMDAIVVCEDLTPSQTAGLDLSRVRGFISQKGSKTSHTAILARALEIPAVLGASCALEYLSPNQTVALDGTTGEVYVEPSADQLAHLKATIARVQSEKKELRALKDLPARTQDGFEVELAANIALEQDLPSVLENGAASVGLYRTEFLFMDKTSAPDEREQFETYKRIFTKLNGRKIFIRTLDIGGDKSVPYLPQKKEENPFLGNRAVRMCLRDEPFFKTQLRAILRAAQFTEVGIMVPMISCIEEVQRTKELIEICRRELAEENLTHATKVEFGVMIEVPSAALIIDHICRYVDFVSIGTNDLTQYVCAVDRMNSDIQELYDAAHPGLIRLVNQVVTTARSHGVFVGICGSVAHDNDLMPLWLGMGVHELSMTAQHILPLKRRIRSLTHAACRQTLEQVLNCETSSEIRALLNTSFESAKM